MEKYILGQSKLGEVTKEHNEIQLDLRLSYNQYYYNTLIYGYIYDNNNNPVAEAKIQFIDNKGEVIGQVYSSQKGLYTYNGVKYGGKIIIKVNKEGYIDYTSDYICISIKILKLDMVMKLNKKILKALISGHIKDNDEKIVAGAFVYLYEHSWGEFKLYRNTVTNEYGQFIFCNIPKGEYLLFIDESQFNIYSNTLKINQCEKIYDMNILLEKRHKITVISGQIKNEEGIPIANSIVILYVVKNQRLLPIKYMKSDAKGRYEFRDLPYGKYIVKSNV